MPNRKAGRTTSTGGGSTFTNLTLTSGSERSMRAQTEALLGKWLLYRFLHPHRLWPQLDVDGHDLEAEADLKDSQRAPDAAIDQFSPLHVGQSKLQEDPFTS